MKCSCWNDMKRVYIRTLKKKRGRVWEPIGWWCPKCKYVSLDRSIRLSQGMTATGSLRKDEGKRV